MDQTQVMGAPGVSDRTMVAGTPTMQMPTGFDPLKTQMGGVATCPVCRANTPSMESYCSECGFLLSSSVTPDLVVPVAEAPIAELVDVTDGRRFKLREGVNTVGRMGTDVLVMDGTISRNHATITVAGDTVTIEDLGSSNGTKVGDLRIGANQPTVAAPGTVVRFGNWRATLERNAAAPMGFERSDDHGGSLGSDRHGRSNGFRLLPSPSPPHPWKRRFLPRRPSPNWKAWK